MKAWLAIGALAVVGIGIAMASSSAAKAAPVDPETGETIDIPPNVREFTSLLSLISLKDGYEDLSGVAIVYPDNERDSVFSIVADVANKNSDVQFMIAPASVIRRMVKMAGRSDLVPDGATGSVAAVYGGEPLTLQIMSDSTSMDEIRDSLSDAVMVLSEDTPTPHSVSGGTIQSFTIFSGMSRGSQAEKPVDFQASPQRSTPRVGEVDRGKS